MLQPNSNDPTSADQHAQAARSDGAGGLCSVTWGVCPDHGATLTSEDGRSECRVADCGRTWDYDRFAAPCAESASHQVRDTAGGTLSVCSAHATAIGRVLEGAVITPLSSRNPG